MASASSEDEEIAERLRLDALEKIFDNPRQALVELTNTTNRFGDTWIVRNYVLDDIIELGKKLGSWDEAIQACRTAKKLKPSYREAYTAKEEEILLLKEGKPIEALRLRLAHERKRIDETGTGYIWPTLHRFGNEFAKLGSHDEAWRLYNEAVIAAAVDGVSPHPICQSMADLLLNENKPNAAVEILITAICEADQYDRVTTTLINDFRKALRAAGFNLRKKRFRSLPDEILQACTDKGRDTAVNLYRARRVELEGSFNQ